MQSTDSPDSATIPTVNLSPAQAQVVAALAQGRTVTAAAREADLHRNTIYNWLDEPAFKTAVEEAQREYVAILSDGMRDLAALALETLRNLLEDPKTPAAVRLKNRARRPAASAFSQSWVASARAHRRAARTASCG